MEPPIEIGAIFLCLMPFAASISFSWREINVGSCDYLGRRTRRTAPFRFLHAVRTEITKEGPHFLREARMPLMHGETWIETRKGDTQAPAHRAILSLPPWRDSDTPPRPKWSRVDGAAQKGSVPRWSGARGMGLGNGSSTDCRVTPSLHAGLDAYRARRKQS